MKAEGKKISHITREIGLSRTTIYKILSEAGADPERVPGAPDD